MNPEGADSDVSQTKEAVKETATETVTKKTDVAEAFNDLFNE